eukprot:g3408.t1
MNDAKNQIKQLIELRSAVEEEINQCVQRLESPGGGGRTGSLVDSEGFPRTDIDIHSVRADRQRIAILTNDHKGLTDQIQHAIEALHRDSRVNGDPSSSSITTSTPVSTQEGCYPFAYVDSVSDESPALAAGIQVGDELCQFGDLKGSRIRNPRILSRLAAALKANEGKQVETKFLRNGQIQTMTLIPQKWGGPGLIGCHLRPLE